MTMTDHDERWLGAARQLARSLRDLGDAPAPPALLAGVLTATGLGQAYAPFATPLGPALVAYSSEGITALSLGLTPAEFEAAQRRRTGRPLRPVAALPAALRRALERRLAGDRDAAPVPVDLRDLTPFEAAVLRKALEVPRGEVRPYGWIAREIGKPGAVRAVGSALGHNPIPLLIPCHRIVRSDGHIGQYALGSELKRRVLAFEGLDPDALERQAAAGERFHGSDTTHIYCFPTCRHARRVTPAHRVVFRSAADAVAAGYRPCKVCRP
jgi:O-6-methylguanine DNA methyltransferase